MLESEAAKYQAAAEKGDADAASKLAAAYDTGEGVVKDYMKAAEWYIKAAEAVLQNFMDEMHAEYNASTDEKRRSVLQDLFDMPEKSPDMWNLNNICYYMDAKDKGEVRSLKFMDNIRRAFICYFKASEENNDPVAKYKLAQFFISGELIERSYCSAANLLEDAAKKGVPEAMCLLGVMYGQGLGVRKNKDLSVYLLNKAKEAGCEEAKYLNDHVNGGTWGVVKSYFARRLFY